MKIKSHLRQLFVRRLWWIGWVPIAKAARPLAKLPVLGRAIRHVPISGEYECVFGDTSIRYVSDKRDLLGRDIFWAGLAQFEPGTQEVLQTYITNQTLFIDVGANTGIYSVLALALGAKKVIAFEPIPAIYGCLVANMAANGASERILALNAAASSNGKSVKFHVPSGPVFATSGSLHTDGFRGVTGELVDVETFRVDDVLESHHLAIDSFDIILVKIDVEGFEAEVLAGMGALLRSRRAIVVFECHPDGPVNDLQMLFDEHSYSISHIDAAGVHQLSSLDTSRTNSGDWNFLALPPQPGARAGSFA